MPFRRAINRLYMKEARRKTIEIKKVKAAKELVLLPGGCITPDTDEERKALFDAQALLKQHGLLPKHTKPRFMSQADSPYFHMAVVRMLNDHLKGETELWEGFCESDQEHSVTPDN